MGLKGAHVLITGEPLCSPPSKPPLTILTGGTRGVGEALVKYFLEQQAEVSYCAPSHQYRIRRVPQLLPGN